MLLDDLQLSKGGKGKMNTDEAFKQAQHIIFEVQTQDFISHIVSWLVC